MQQIIQSEATAAQRRIPLYLVDATDGFTPETGITFTAGDIKISKAGAAEANHAGTVTELAGGRYYYEATTGEVDTLGFLFLTFTKAGVQTFPAAVQVIAAPYTGADTAGTTTLLSRLTAGRATNLDNLDVASSTLSTYDGSDTTGTTTLLARLSAARALLLDNLDVAVSTRLAAAGYTVPPTLSAIVDAVLDEAIASHLDSGSVGAAINAAGSAGDPWGTTLPGAYGAGTAGNILGNRLDAAVSSRSSHAAADIWSVTTRAITDKAGFSLSAAGVQAIWDALTSALTTVGSIGKRIADNLNATIDSRMATFSYTAPPTVAQIRTEMDDNSTKLANLDAAVTTRSTHSAADVWAVGTRALTDKAGFSLTAGERTSIAEALLKLDWTTVTGEAARSVLNALRFLRNKWSLVSTTLTVTKEDDTTPAWTATVTTDAGAEPVTGSDPS